MSELIRKIPRFSLVRARKTGPEQIVPEATEAIPQFNTVDVDRIGEYNPTTYIFTAKKTGFYLIAGTLQITVSGTEELMVFRLYINGVFMYDNFNYIAAVVGGVRQSFAFYVRIIQGQTAQVRYFNVGIGTNIITASNNSYLLIKRLE